jgi:Iron-containing redox enzyme
MCYELHYRGFAGVDPTWEWNPALLALRAELERSFLAGVRRDVGRIEPHHTAAAEMEALCVEPADGSDVTGPSYHLRDAGTWQQMREYFVHRSLYHLKEGDPHAWAIPRLTGGAKAAFVAVEFDEYGAGHGPRMHQQLFADLLSAAGLDSTYLGYLDAVPAEALAVVNIMSMFGLHRWLRGAAIGHFAATEITSPPGSRRIADALRRMEAPRECIAFYQEHVEADAVHEHVVRVDVVGDLVAREPQLDRDVVFGMRAHSAVENRLADCIIGAWKAGHSSLRQPLD